MIGRLLLFLALALPAAAAVTFNGTSDTVTATFSGINGNAITIAGWLKPAGTSGEKYFLAQASSSETSRVQIGRNAANARFMVLNSSAASRTITDAGSMTPGTWYHICGVMASSITSELYVNGASVGTAAGRTTTNQDRLIIGATMITGTASAHMDGDVAEVAVWNVGLTAAEVASLARGFSPLLVRPMNLVFYAPLVKDIKELRAGLSLTTSGTTAASHTRIYQ